MKMSLRIICFFILSVFPASECLSAISLDSSSSIPKRGAFYFGADAESFAIFPVDFSRLLKKNSPAEKEFSLIIQELGRPALRLASMQRWDWRGEKATRALVGYRKYSEIPYPYFEARSYYDFAKKNHVKTIPMLDTKFFYDQADGVVKVTPDNVSAAASQYAAGYAKFIRDGNYDVVFWEIGNEDYAGNYGFPPNADDYAKVVRNFIDAVRLVDPNARFGIQYNDWKPEWRRWSFEVLEKLKGYEKYVNFAVVHYYSAAAFTDRTTDQMVSNLREKGFATTELAITEWRHDYRGDSLDQHFHAASQYARFLLFLIRHPDIDVSCVHAFPIFGGLAEWSNGQFWSSYSGNGPRQRQKDSSGKAHWRILPFGLAQRMIMDATKGNRLADYKENPGGLSTYLFNKPAGGYSLVLVNEGPGAVHEKISVRTKMPLARVTGQEVFCLDPDAIPQDVDPQPWSVKPVQTTAAGDISKGSGFLLANGVINAAIRPFAVITLDLQ
jgi:hypothetical protein